MKKIDIKKFKINNYLTLKLIDDKTYIYVSNKRYRELEKLFYQPKDNFKKIDREVKSMDDLAEILDHYDRDIMRYEYKIPSKDLFWGHCSNIQVWVEENYNTVYLHRNLAFPLLRKLLKEEDPIALKVYKKEIEKRFKDGILKVKSYIIQNGYLKDFDRDDLLKLLEEFIQEYPELNHDYLSRNLRTKTILLKKFILYVDNYEKFLEKIFDYAEYDLLEDFKQIMKNIGFLKLNEENILNILEFFSREHLKVIIPLLIDLLEFKPIHKHIKYIAERLYSNKDLFFIQKALIFNENSLESLNLMTKAYYNVKLYNEAEILADKALMMNNNNWKSYYFKGCINLLMGRIKEADKLLSKAYKFAPSGYLIKKKKSEPLIYHQQIFNILQITPYISISKKETLEQKELALNIIIPEAIKEWYSIVGSEEILLTYSNDDLPVSLTDLDINEQDMIDIIYENQAVCKWAVMLNGNNDPPVMITSTSKCSAKSTENWNELFHSFSNFIYTRITNYYFFLINRSRAQVLIEFYSEVPNEISNYLCEHLLEISPRLFFKKINPIILSENVFAKHDQIWNNSLLFVDNARNQFIKIYSNICSIWAKNQKNYEELLKLVLDYQLSIKRIETNNELIVRNAINYVMNDFPSLQNLLNKELSAPILISLVVIEEKIPKIDPGFCYYHQCRDFEIGKKKIILRTDGFSSLSKKEYYYCVERADGIILIFKQNQLTSNKFLNNHLELINAIRPTMPILIIRNNSDQNEINEFEQLRILDLIKKYGIIEYRIISENIDDQISQIYEDFILNILKIVK